MQLDSRCEKPMRKSKKKSTFKIDDKYLTKKNH